MENKPASHPLITRVWAKNFRSIEFAEMELSPLTVLVGPNASGKSNLLDALRFIADAVNDGLDSAITARGGINSIGRKSARGRAYDPEIGLRFEDNESIIDYEFAIANRGSGEYQVKREYFKVEVKVLSVKPFEVEIRNGRLTKPNLGQAKDRLGQYENKPGMLYYDIFNSRERLVTQKFDQNNLILTSDRYLALLTALLTLVGMDAYYNNRIVYTFWTLKNYLEDTCFYHIFPNVLRDPQKVSDPYPLGGHGENLASALRDMIRRHSPFLPELKQALGYVVLGVRDIKVTQAGSFLVVELDHSGAADNGRKAWFDLSLESDGTLRLLGLLVALLQDPSPSLIAIEEPELTIHPGALGVLADIMEEAKLRTQVLVTTHSPDLIDRLPIESIRAVTAEGGSTKVGMVADYQVRSVKEGLFLPGELHRMEGLQVAGKED
jgi:predicted ATPase